MCDKCRWHDTFVIAGRLMESGKADMFKTWIADAMRGIATAHHVTKRQLAALALLERKAGKA